MIGATHSNFSRLLSRWMRSEEVIPKAAAKAIPKLASPITAPPVTRQTLGQMWVTRSALIQLMTLASKSATCWVIDAYATPFSTATGLALDGSAESPGPPQPAPIPLVLSEANGNLPSVLSSTNVDIRGSIYSGFFSKSSKSFSSEKVISKWFSRKIHRSEFQRLVYVGSALASNPWNDVRHKVSVDPVENTCINVSHLELAWNIGVSGAAINANHVSHAPCTIGVSDDHGHSCFDVQKDWIRLGRRKGARMIN